MKQSESNLKRSKNTSMNGSTSKREEDVSIRNFHYTKRVKRMCLIECTKRGFRMGMPRVRVRDFSKVVLNHSTLEFSKE
jgi:hypothetical protein